MLRYLVVSLSLLSSGCAGLDVSRADWCVSRGKLVVTIPTDPLPHKHTCKSREFLERILQ